MSPCTSHLRKSAHLLLVCLLVMSAGTVADNRQSPLGINISGIGYGARQWIFTNIFRSTNHWSTNTGELELRPDGYPARLAAGQQAKAMMERCDDGSYLRGEYTLLYDGEGTWGSWLNTDVISQEPGRVVFRVGHKSGNGFGPVITSTNPDNPVRNVRAYLPGTTEAQRQQTFHPLFLHSLRNYSVLRFMDWGGTNHSPLVNWEDRHTPDYNRGIAIEHMVELANTLNADAWFCMPHRATDDFVRRHAELVRNTLKPHLRVYIEYSNEVWNWNFTQATYCDSMGAAAGLSNGRHLKYYARRAVEIFAIWEQVFGGTERLVRVLAAQSNNPSTGRTICASEDAYRHADVLAVAPYFGNGISSTSVTDILNKCEADIEGERVKTRTAENAATAAQYGLRLVAYEAGQHLTQRNPSDAMVAAFIDANYHDRMGELYSRYYEVWKEQGGTLLCVFANTGRYSKWGCWGVLEFADQDTLSAPKYLATQQFAVLTPKWWDEPELAADAGLPRRRPVWQSSRASGSSTFDLRGRFFSCAPVDGFAPLAPGLYIRIARAAACMLSVGSRR